MVVLGAGARHPRLGPEVGSDDTGISDPSRVACVSNKL